MSRGVYRTSPGRKCSHCSCCSWKPAHIQSPHLYWTSGLTSSLCWASVLTIGLVLRTEVFKAEGAVSSSSKMSQRPVSMFQHFSTFFNSKFQVQHFQIKSSGPRTPRHGAHLARQPYRFPGQKGAESLRSWLPLSRSMSNKTLTCFSNKR